MLLEKNRSGPLFGLYKVLFKVVCQPHHQPKHIWETEQKSADSRNCCFVHPCNKAAVLTFLGIMKRNLQLREVYALCIKITLIVFFS